jgi:hypothetical protein
MSKKQYQSNSLKDGFSFGKIIVRIAINKATVPFETLLFIKQINEND